MYSQSEEQQADCLSKNATNTIYYMHFCEFRLVRTELYSSCKWNTCFRYCTVSI